MISSARNGKMRKRGIIARERGRTSYQRQYDSLSSHVRSVLASPPGSRLRSQHSRIPRGQVMET